MENTTVVTNMGEEEIRYCRCIRKWSENGTCGNCNLPIKGEEVIDYSKWRAGKPPKELVASIPSPVSGEKVYRWAKFDKNLPVKENVLKATLFRCVGHDIVYFGCYEERYAMFVSKDMETQINPFTNEVEFQEEVSLPVKADEWISIKDELPGNDSGRVLCWIEEQNDLGKSEYFWNCAYGKLHGFTDNGKTYQVTRWKKVTPPAK